jgi:hypothetical protein
VRVSNWLMGRREKGERGTCDGLGRVRVLFSLQMVIGGDIPSKAQGEGGVENLGWHMRP